MIGKRRNLKVCKRCGVIPIGKEERHETYNGYPEKQY